MGEHPKSGRREGRPSFQFYPQDFLASDSVAQMTHEEVGLYILLLCRAWVGPGLPADLARVARLVGVPEKRFRTIWAGPLGTCFVEVDGRLVNPRMERERALLVELSAKRATAGARGGKAKADAQQTASNPATLLEQSASKGGGEGRDSDSGSVQEGVQGEVPPHADDEWDATPWPVTGHSLQDIPPAIDEAFQRWAVHRNELGRPLKRSSIAELVRTGCKDPAAFARRVTRSIEGGTITLLPDEPIRGTNGHAARLTPREAQQQRAHESGAKLEEFLAQLQGTTKPAQIGGGAA